VQGPLALHAVVLAIFRRHDYSDAVKTGRFDSAGAMLFILNAENIIDTNHHAGKAADDRKIGPPGFRLFRHVDDVAGADLGIGIGAAGGEVLFEIEAVFGLLLARRGDVADLFDIGVGGGAARAHEHVDDRGAVIVLEHAGQAHLAQHLDVVEHLAAGDHDDVAFDEHGIVLEIPLEEELLEIVFGDGHLAGLAAHELDLGDARAGRGAAGRGDGPLQVGVERHLADAGLLDHAHDVDVDDVALGKVEGDHRILFEIARELGDDDLAQLVDGEAIDRQVLHEGKVDGALGRDRDDTGEFLVAVDDDLDAVAGLDAALLGHGDGGEDEQDQKDAVQMLHWDPLIFWA